MKDTAVFSVVVAALAVIIGAVMQYFTLKLTRRNTVSGLRVGVVESSLSSLRNVLSEYLPLLYQVDLKFRDFKIRGTPLSEEYYKLVLQEEKLRVLIQLCLDQNEETHQLLLTAIEDLRGESDELWLPRRDKVILRANAVIAHDRSQALGVT